MIKKATPITTRWPNEIIDDIEKLVKSPITPDGKFKNASEVIRECTLVGIKVHHYQEMMKDPNKAEEFRKKMQEMIQNEEILDWVQTLDQNQIDGFLMALQMEKDNRYKVTKLV